MVARFFSVAKFAGCTGTWFYSRFFALHGLDHTYTARGAYCLEPVIERFKQDVDARGLSVSMPFKQDALSYLDHLSPECQMHGMCNTIVKNDDQLIGHNCDHAGAVHVIRMIKDQGPVMILGNGAIGKMMASMLPNDQLSVVARNLGNWDDRHGPASVLINATGFGTVSAVSPVDHLHPEVSVVVDMAMKHGDLARQCQERGIRYLDGLVFYRYQFAKQYKLYTGIDIGSDELDDAINDYRRLFLS